MSKAFHINGLRYILGKSVELTKNKGDYAGIMTFKGGTNSLLHISCRIELPCSHVQDKYISLFRGLCLKYALIKIRFKILISLNSKRWRLCI